MKVETTNPIRSFKARGAQFFVSQLTDRPHLVSATADNFGQGMAYAARKHGLPITINVNASPLKVAHMHDLGADVRLIGPSPNEALAAAPSFAAKAGALLVQDGR